jgi:hypothetical protein
MKTPAVTLVIAGALAWTGASWAYLPLTRGEATGTLSADVFARALAGTANGFRSAAKIVNVHCVQGYPGDYMCSYAVLRRGRTECHLMQGRWSSATGEIDVLLAGRTKRCATLRDAVHSLV